MVFSSRWSRRPVPLGRRVIQTIALLVISVLLVGPLAVLAQSALHEGVVTWWQALTLPIAWYSLLLTLWSAALVALLDLITGTLIAYVLVHDQFPGKTILNALIDLPLTIPTLVTGIMFVLCFGPETALGDWLVQHFQFEVIFAPPGIILVLLFITLPFVVRAVQSVLEAIDPAPAAAAATLGASGWTIFWRLTVPEIFLPATSGALLAFARSIGEFGAIVLVAGNIPFHTMTAAVYVWSEIESNEQLGASAVSLILVTLAFVLMILVDRLQQRIQHGRSL